MTKMFLALFPSHGLWLSFRFICPLVELFHVFFGVAILVQHALPEVWIFNPAVFAARKTFRPLGVCVCIEDFNPFQAALVDL